MNEIKVLLVIGLMIDFVGINALDIDFQAPSIAECEKNLKNAGLEDIAQNSGICNRCAHYESDGPWLDHRIEASCVMYANNKTDDNKDTINFAKTDNEVKEFGDLVFNDCMSKKKALLAAIYKDKPNASYQLEELTAPRYLMSSLCLALYPEFPSTNPNDKFAHELIEFPSKKELEADLQKAGFANLIENTAFCDKLTQSKISGLGVVRLVGDSCYDFNVKTKGDYTYSELCVERKKDLFKILFKNNPELFDALRLEGLLK